MAEVIGKGADGLVGAGIALGEYVAEKAGGPVYLIAAGYQAGEDAAGLLDGVLLEVGQVVIEALAETALLRRRAPEGYKVVGGVYVGQREGSGESAHRALVIGRRLGTSW